jgi:hypothetical protein
MEQETTGTKQFSKMHGDTMKGDKFTPVGAKGMFLLDTRWTTGEAALPSDFSDRLKSVSIM